MKLCKVVSEKLIGTTVTWMLISCAQKKEKIYAIIDSHLLEFVCTFKEPKHWYQINEGIYKKTMVVNLATSGRW